jgi:methylase of polypeptide subunit release factors
MTVIRALVAQAEARLAEGGVLLMEIDARRAREAAACADGGRWQDVRIVADLFGRDRFVVAKRTAEPARTEPAGRGAPQG